jgi:hypothetical protein
MLEFIKKLFGSASKEKKEGLSVRESELQEWYEKRLEDAKSRLDDDLKSIKDKIDSEIMHLKENIDILEKAELRNPDIHKKELQYMEGNRDAYVKKMKSFANQNQINYDNYEAILGFCERFGKELITLGKGTARQYIIIQNFFANESREVALNVKNIETYVKGLNKTITSSEYNRLSSIKNNVFELEAKKQSRKALKEELESFEKTLKELENEKEKAKKKIINDENSDEYAEYKSQENELKELKKKIAEEEQALFHNFSVIENGLKKYRRMDIGNDKLIKGYLEDPVNTAANDKNMIIISIIQRMIIMLEKNKLDLKDKKKDKTILALNEMNADYFKHYHDKIGFLSSKREELEQKIILCRALQEISASRSKVEEIEGEIININRRVAIIKTDLDKINIEKIKKNIQMLIKESIGENMTIT